MRSQFVILSIVFLLCGTIQGQEISTKLNRAEKFFDQLAFSAAIPLYEELAGDSDDPKLRIRLGDACRLTDDYVRAEYWYSTLFDAQISTQIGAQIGAQIGIDTLDPVYRLYYAQALMANEKYDQARGWFLSYAKARPEDSRGKTFAEACSHIEDLISQSFPAEIQTLPFNSARSEIGPAFYGTDGLLFAADRDTILGVRRNNDWYDAPFMDFYTVGRDAEGMVSDEKVRPLKGNVNARYHEGPGSLSGDRVLYFTQSSPRGAEGTEGAAHLRSGLLKLSIQKAIRTSSSGNWMVTGETAIPFNNQEYSCAHPSLSTDGLLMVFSSDMPGGFGGADLYFAALKADGSAWGDPINPGAKINSPGDEMFPFLHADGTLFYASDGLPGLGGLDVFETRKEGEEWQVPRNMGKPLNSSRDDFGLIFDEQLSTGFMVSNRFGGAGRDDVYGVKNVGIELGGTVLNAFTGEKISGAVLRLRLSGEERSRTSSGLNGEYQFAVGTNRKYELVASAPGHLRKVLPVEIGDLKFPASVHLDFALEDTLVLKLVVQVVDKDSRIPLTDARVMVYNKCTNVNNEVAADDEGLLRVRLEPNCTFYIAGRKLGYLDDNDVVSTMGMSESAELATVLELTEIKEDLIIELKNIYYDYGRYYIREDAVGDLDNLSALLEQYPSLKIEISSHTDSRGSDDYNKGLSQKRAETCVDYLVTKGIAKDRLVARGYGEYALRNGCASDVACTEEQHQVNRRTEFKVLSFDRVLYSEEVESPAVNLYKNAFGDDGKYLAKIPGMDQGPGDPNEPNEPLIVQKSPGNPVTDPSQRASSSLLNRQQEASRAAAIGVGDELNREDAGLSDQQSRADRNKNTKARKTVVLEPDPVPAPAPRTEKSTSENRPVARKKPVPPENPANTGRRTSSELAIPALSPTVVPRTEPRSEAENIPADAANATSEWWKQGVSYAVQIAYGTTNTAAFSAYGDLGLVLVDKKANGVSVIVVGYYPKYSEANAIQQVLRSRGLKDAFVVSYVDGKRLE